ncbi:MAG: mercuric transport protein MerTP [Cytophagaceae bacterium]|nr:mercuric transport protein MerTP [Cytophagaceae bacterium]
MNKSSKSLAGASILAAITASICCITPVLALLASITGIASVFSWLEPFRPYIIGITAIILGVAWYKALKPKDYAECACEDEKAGKKKTFINTKAFLSIITLLAVLLMAFPYYSKIFFAEQKSKEVVIVDKKDIEKVKFNIEGMTCQGCEAHINSELSKLTGVIDYKTSSKEGTSIVSFDKFKTNVDTITKAINATGYKVSNYSIIKG